MLKEMVIQSLESGEVNVIPKWSKAEKVATNIIGKYLTKQCLDAGLVFVLRDDNGMPIIKAEDMKRWKKWKQQEKRKNTEHGDI